MKFKINLLVKSNEKSNKLIEKDISGFLFHLCWVHIIYHNSIGYIV